MTTRRFTRAPRRRGNAAPRKPVSWENLAFTAAHSAAASVVVADLTPEPMQTVHAGVGLATVRRALLHFDFMHNGVDVSVSEQEIFIGIAVVTEDALAAGSLPDPASDFNHDWYYWTFRTHKWTTAASQPPQISWDADIRSMRRLRGGYRLVMISENDMQDNATILRTGMRLLWNQSA